MHDRIVYKWNSRIVHYLATISDITIELLLCLLLLCISGLRSVMPPINEDWFIDDANIFHTMFSERELTFTFAICRRPSVRLSAVCRLSVTFVHPTRAIEIFGNVSMPFNTLAITEVGSFRGGWCESGWRYTDTFCSGNVGQRIKFLVIYHLRRYWPRIIPRESVNVRHSFLASETLTNNQP